MTDSQVSHLFCIPAPHGIFHIHNPGNAGDKSKCIPHQLTPGGHTADPMHLDVEPRFQVSRSLLGHVQFSSVTQSCPSLCDPMDYSTSAFPMHHRLPEPAQTHVHWVGDAIQPSHPLSSPSPPAFNLSQLQDLFKGLSSSHQVAKILEFQLQHQSFQWILRTDFL